MNTSDEARVLGFSCVPPPLFLSSEVIMTPAYTEMSTLYPPIKIEPMSETSYDRPVLYQDLCQQAPADSDTPKPSTTCKEEDTNQHAIKLEIEQTEGEAPLSSVPKLSGKVFSEKLEVKSNLKEDVNGNQVMPGHTETIMITQTSAEKIAKQTAISPKSPETLYKISAVKLESRVNPNRLSYKCNFCRFRFKTTIHLTNHLLDHAGVRHKCGLISPCHLKEPPLTHTVVKQHNCSVCGKVFDDQGALLKHQQNHVKKPYKCPHCEGEFSHEAALSTHLHSHMEYKPHCTVCGSVFRRRYTLAVHMRTHTGEKPYKCLVCNKAFAHSWSFTRHRRTHLGYKITLDKNLEK